MFLTQNSNGITEAVLGIQKGKLGLHQEPRLHQRKLWLRQGKLRLHQRKLGRERLYCLSRHQVTPTLAPLSVVGLSANVDAHNFKTYTNIHTRLPEGSALSKHRPSQLLEAPLCFQARPNGELDCSRSPKAACGFASPQCVDDQWTAASNLRDKGRYTSASIVLIGPKSTTRKKVPPLKIPLGGLALF